MHSPGEDVAAANGDRRERARRGSHLRRLFSLTWQHRGRCAVAFFWDLIVAALALSGFVVTGLALDVLRHHAAPESPPPRWPFGLAPPQEWGLIQVLALTTGLLLGFTLLRAVAAYFARLTDERLIQTITIDLRSTLYDKLQRMPFTYFDTHDSGGLINRVTGDAASVRMFVQGVVLQLIIAAGTMVLFIGYLFSEHIWLTLALLAVLPLEAWVLVRYTRRVAPLMKTSRESIDRLIANLQETIIGIKVVKGFGQERAVERRFEEVTQTAADARLDVTRTAASLLPWVMTLGFIQLAILLAYGGYLVKIGPAAGGIALGTMWVFFGLIRQLNHQVDNIVSSASMLPEALTGAERVFELLDAPIEIASPIVSAPLREPVSRRGAEKSRGAEGASVVAAIAFENVSLGYGDGPLVLEDVSFTVEPGETVALVGPAGSGKSTLLHLVGRFYDVTAGRVTVDGIDVREWDLAVLRRAIGLVAQEPFLFSNTIANNVRFGDLDLDEAAVRRAVEDAEAIEFIERMPERFATIVGERGLNLSGGERQRLTLARAIAIAPPILLLDDAMSAVDARTEVRIAASLDRLRGPQARFKGLGGPVRGRTTLIVAHRLSTLRRADRIVVLERGRVTAIGRHDELMETNEHYRESAHIQLERELRETQGGAWASSPCEVNGSTNDDRDDIASISHGPEDHAPEANGLEAHAPGFTREEAP